MSEEQNLKPIHDYTLGGLLTVDRLLRYTITNAATGEESVTVADIEKILDILQNDLQRKVFLRMLSAHKAIATLAYNLLRKKIDDWGSEIKTIDVIIPTTEGDLGTENQHTLMYEIFRQIQSLQDAVKKDEKRNQEIFEIKRVSKRGRQRYSDPEKMQALKEWDELDKNFKAISLEEFLIHKFGENKDGSPRVPKQTFHGWRGQLKRKGRYLNS